jgi:hypothetical protein
LYLQARELNPARWAGSTRNWTPIGAVTLNPERDSSIKTHLAGNDIQPLAAMTEATTTLTRAAWMVRGMGLKFEGRVNGASHALVFKRAGNLDKNICMLLSAIAKLVGPLLNTMIPILGATRIKMRKK